MRENFEKWVKETSYSTDWSREGGGVNPDSEYLKPRVRDAWACWQAAAMWRGNADDDTIYSAYLGICVLKTMCRKAGLELAEQRAKELLIELGTAFPFIPERVGQSALRRVACQRCDRRSSNTIQSGDQIVCWDCAKELAFDDLRASGGIVGAP